MASESGGGNWDQWAKNIEMACETQKHLFEQHFREFRAMEGHMEKISEGMALHLSGFREEMKVFFGQAQSQLGGQAEQERQKLGTELSGLVNEFLMRCQQGENNLQHIADCQKQLLSIAIEREVGEKIKVFEVQVNKFMDLKFSEFRDREENLRRRLDDLHDATHNLVDLSQKCEDNRKGLHKLSGDVNRGLRELGERWDKNVQDIVGECRNDLAGKDAQICTLGTQYKSACEALRDCQKLVARMDRLEGVFGAQVSWEKMTDFMGKIEEAVQIQVRQAMSLQDKKIMEMMMTKILDENVRDGRNAEMCVVFVRWLVGKLFVR